MKTYPIIQDYPVKVRVEMIRDGTPKEKHFISGPSSVDELIGDYMRRQDREVILALYLNTRNRLLGIEEICRGTIDTALMYPRDVVKSALLIGARALILAHNHPSGDSTPSTADREVTTRVRKACEMFSISLLDHIIFGDSFYSLYS